MGKNGVVLREACIAAYLGTRSDSQRLRLASEQNAACATIMSSHVPEALLLFCAIQNSMAYRLFCAITNDMIYLLAKK